MKLTQRILAVGIAAALSLCPQSTREQKIFFAQAKKHPQLREMYVEQLRKRLDGEAYLGRMVYNPKLRDGARITNKIVGDTGTGKIYSLEVGVNAFDEWDDENDALNGIVDHEVKGHAELFHKGFPSGITDESFLTKDRKTYNGTLLTAFIEAYAYKNQILNAGKRGISVKAKETALLNWWIHYSDLIHPLGENELLNSETLVRARILAFIPGLRGVSISAELKNGETYVGPMFPNDHSMVTRYGTAPLSTHVIELLQKEKLGKK